MTGKDSAQFKAKVQAYELAQKDLEGSAVSTRETEKVIERAQKIYNWLTKDFTNKSDFGVA